MKNSTQPLSWKAKRRGPIYCAPACGSDCLRSEFEQATAKAKRLAKRLGKHFAPRVWENGGWHWEVFAGNITVGLDRDGKTYHAHFSHNNWVRAKTAKGVLIALEKDIQKDVAEEQAKLDEIRSIYW